MKTALFTILLLLPMVARAYDFSVVNSDGITIYYSYAEGGVSVVQGEEKYKGNVKIPSSVEFNSIYAIGQYAFLDCVSLETINFPESLRVLEGECFHNCKSIKEVNLPNSVFLSWGVFDLCENLKKVTLPNDIEKLSRGLFWGCVSLTDITLPSTLMQIGEGG